MNYARSIPEIVWERRESQTEEIATISRLVKACRCVTFDLERNLTPDLIRNIPNSDEVAFDPSSASIPNPIFFDRILRSEIKRYRTSLMTQVFDDEEQSRSSSNQVSLENSREGPDGSSHEEQESGGRNCRSCLYHPGCTGCKYCIVCSGYDGCMLCPGCNWCKHCLNYMGCKYFKKCTLCANLAGCSRCRFCVNRVVYREGNILNSWTRGQGLDQYFDV